MRRIIASVLLLTILIVAFCCPTLAEDVDISSRLDDTVLEYEGVRYRHRNRLTSLVFIGLENAPEGAGAEKTPAIIALIVVDDDEKRITPIFPDEGLSLKLNAKVELIDVTNDKEHDEILCETMLSAVNKYLGDDLIEYYVALDEEGLTILDGKDAGSAPFRERVSMLKDTFAATGANEASRMLSDLGPYMCSNVKSGLMMKILDKADRYDIAERVTLFADDDDPAVTESIINIFYEESPWVN